MGANGNRSQPIRIRSYVFLDFEATGLFPEEPLNPLNSPHLPGDPYRDAGRLLTTHIKTTNPKDAPRVTEVCALSVSRSQVEASVGAASTSREEESLLDAEPVHSVVRLPCNVHTRQINPQLSEAGWMEYESRRARCKAIYYSRSQLEERNTFVTEWEGIKLFLLQLPKPLCILAHNGIRYDFRVLYAEFYRGDLLEKKPFPEETYFLDTYVMFMDLEKQLHDELRFLTQAVDWCRVARVVKNPAPSVAHPLVTQINCEYIGKTLVSENAEQVLKDGSRENITIEEEIRLKQYETPRKQPPEHRASSEPARVAKRRLRFETSEDHPLQFARMDRWSPAKKIRVRPNFFQRTADGDWQFDSHFAMKYFTEKGVFRLDEMYYQLTNRKFDAHFAQDDCEALLQVCLAYGHDFIKYVDEHATPFPF